MTAYLIAAALTVWLAAIERRYRSGRREPVRETESVG